MLDTRRRLDADWVIGGAYQRVGDRIRITARLVHIETAAVVQTAKLDGVMGDLFMLQDRLAAGLIREPGAASRQPETAVAPLPESRTTRPPGTGSGLASAMPGLFIDAPPPPVAPDTVTRDPAGQATIRAVRLTEPLTLAHAPQGSKATTLRLAGQPLRRPRCHREVMKPVLEKNRSQALADGCRARVADRRLRQSYS